MTTKVTLIVGVPAVGKSTIVKQLLGRGEWSYYKIPYICFHVNMERNLLQPPGETPIYDGRVYVIGRYDDMSHKYAGTDRLSMACQSRVIQFIRNRPGASFIIEGDRLGGISFLAAMEEAGYDVQLIHVTVDRTELAKRRAQERSDQTPKFWQAKLTKVTRLIQYARSHSQVSVRELPHTNPADTLSRVRHLEETRF